MRQLFFSDLALFGIFCSSCLEGVLQRGFVSGNLEKKIDPDDLGPDDPGSAVKFDCDGDQEIAVKRLLYFSIRLLSVGAVELHWNYF